MPDFPFDTKSFFAGVAAGQGFKGRARPALPPPPEGVPLEYLEFRASQPDGNSVNNPGWTFEQSAFCAGIAAGRALEGWELDAMTWHFKGDVIAGGLPYSWWTFYSTGLLYIYCAGSTGEFSSFSYVPWGIYENQITDVLISDSVTYIGSLAFATFRNLEKVTIPNHAILFGVNVFLGCKSLQTITLPDSMTTIPFRFFEDSGLTSITIPPNVTAIQAYAFYGCTSLTSVTIPASVTTIWDGAFGGCPSLTDVYYAGTAQQWKNISISRYPQNEGAPVNFNASLINATKHYNSTGPDDVHD